MKVIDSHLKPELEFNLESFLLEARGEYPEFEKNFATLFPSLWNNLKGHLQTYFPIATKRNLQEEELIQSKYIGGNLKLEIRTLSHSDRQVSAILGVDNVVSAQLLAIPILDFLILLTGTVKRISKGPGLNYFAVDKNGKVNFKEKAKILLFVNKGLLVELTPEERTALYLWIIFDWATIIDEIGASFFASIPVIGIIPAIIISRKFVYRIDSKVVQAGYGEHLRSALKKTGLEVRDKNSSWWVRWLDLLTKIGTKVGNAIQTFLPIFGVPSQKQRDKKLSELTEFEKKSIATLDKSLSLAWNKSMKKAG